MNGVRLVSSITSLVMLIASGCAVPSEALNPMAMREENSRLRSALDRQQDQLARSRDELRQLDEDNEQLHAVLAQEQSSLRLARAALDRTGPDGQATTTALHPDVESQATASRQPANGRWLPLVDVPGGEVYRDGAKIRIRLDSSTLFLPGDDVLLQESEQQLTAIADVLDREYPGQLIGLEGHTDSDPIRRSKWRHNHDLSVQRAMAVYDFLVHQRGVSKGRLFVAGYGPNRPVASNADPKGKAQNRRIEFVVLPLAAQ